MNPLFSNNYNPRHMHDILILLFIFLSFTTLGQNNINEKSNESQREQDLLNFIKSDMDLYNHYMSGKKNLSTGRKMGYMSLGFMAATGVSIYSFSQASHINDALGSLFIGFLSFVTSAITGTIGTILHFRGKGKIEDIMDYAYREHGRYTKSLELKTTENGIGLVYSF